MKPVLSAPILGASVEANRVSGLCSAVAPPDGTRERILAWLAEGARDITWALCTLPRERWAAQPPRMLSDWSALRHARHVALREARVTLPSVRQALGEVNDEMAPSLVELEQAEAAWDPAAAIEEAEAIVRGLGETRFELLQRLESAPNAAWERSTPGRAPAGVAGSPVPLDWLMLHAHQHELEHLAAIWKVVLYWDRVSPAADPARGWPGKEERATGLQLHPADRLEESH